MKWSADWTGVNLIAETPEDKELLERLHSTLPKNATDYEDIGVLEVAEKDPWTLLTLIFYL